MAVAVNNPNRAPDVQQEKPVEKMSDMDKILKALQMANLTMGIVSDVDKINTGMSNRKLQEEQIGVLQREKEKQERLQKGEFSLFEAAPFLQKNKLEFNTDNAPTNMSMKVGDKQMYLKPAVNNDQALKAEQIKAEQAKTKNYSSQGDLISAQRGKVLAETDQLTKNNPKVTALETSLRKEIEDHPSSKRFDIIDSAYQGMKTTSQSPAGDLALVFSVMKVFDPTSTVRESEQASAKNAAGVPDQISSAWNKMLTGETLTEEQRMDFIKAAESKYTVEKNKLDKIYSKYEGIAKRNNLNWDNILLNKTNDSTDLIANAQKNNLRTPPRNFSTPGFNEANASGGSPVFDPSKPHKVIK